MQKGFNAKFRYRVEEILERAEDPRSSSVKSGTFVLILVYTWD